MDQYEDQEENKQVEEILPPSQNDPINNSNSTQPEMPSPPHPQQQQQLVQYNTWNNKPKYKECLKNHAVGIGGHAVDGCGEFMPAGEDGSLDSLKCAACNCHRNFHRKVPTTQPPTEHFIYHPSYYRSLPPPCGYLHHVAPQQRPLALPSTSGGGVYREDLEDMFNPNNTGGSGSKKRFRTKFSHEQKGKMLELADKLGWRIQRDDEELVQQFCNETGVRRQVFKVWMHNNKHTLGKKTLEEKS